MVRRWVLAAVCMLAPGFGPGGALGEERALELQMSAALLQRLVSESRTPESEAARSDILNQNTRLENLEVGRQGDRLTLTFVPREQGAPPRLYLAGTRRDFLLLAMAENPADVFSRLSALDPEIRFAEARRSAQQLTLILGYRVQQKEAPRPSQPAARDPGRRNGGAGAAVYEAARGNERALEAYLESFPGGSHAAEAEQELQALRTARMQAEYEAALSSGDPEAIQAFMARWGSGSRVGSTGREVRLQVQGPTGAFASAPAPAAASAPPVEEAPASPEPPAPSLPSAEERAEGPYRAALALGTVEALSQFVAAFPDAPQRAAAAQRIEELREEAAFRLAVEKNTADAYQGFLAIFPSSGRRAEVQARLQTVEAERQRAESERKASAAAQSAQQAQHEQRRRAYDEVRRLDGPEGYRIFVATYPGTPEVQQAEKRLKELEADDEAFAKARASEPALERYLAERPQGRHAAEARERVAQLRSARMDADFQTARTAGTAEAYRAFLSRWPNGPRTQEARSGVEAAERAAAQRAAAAAAAAEPPAPARQPVPEPAPEPTPPPPLRLAVRRVAAGPELTASPQDAAWRSAQAVEIPLQGPAGSPRKVRMKAVHDGTSVYLLAEWADPSRDDAYRPWVWDPVGGSYRQTGQLDDAFSVLLYREGSASSACMLEGQEVDADLWLWRAGWGALSSLADDGRLRVSRNRIPQANPYPVRSGQGQVWIRQDWDEGTPGWSLFIPVGRTTDTVPSYRAARPKGSRGDVAASGSWSDGRWTVTFRRALDTGHSDDVPLVPGASLLASFAAYDKADRADHASSPPVYLDVQGP